MTTAANAISSFVEVGTITPGYAAVRAHRPLQGRLVSRKALLTSTVLAGAFGLVAAEAIAQQYNLPGSGGFTDVSSSINVVTDAGGGNIRVVLADGVQFFAAPGQYQLNPMTSSLQVATDVLLNAYTGAAPVAAQQTQQAFSASQAQAYTTPTVYPSNAALTLGANQYATQPSVVGGYQMQPATATYSAPSMAYGAQSGQYVPAYSAGVAGYGQIPSYATFAGAGTAASTFGGMQQTPVSSAIPTNQMAMAPAVPAAAAAASGGMLGIPTWALVGGGVAAGGAALLALGSLGGDSSATSPSSNLTIAEQNFLNQPGVQAALGNSNSGSQATGGSTSGGTSGGSTTTTTSGGITVSGGSSGSGSSSNNDSGSSYTVPAGSSGQTITGSAADDTVTFADGVNIHNIAAIDLKGGDGDRVILKDVDKNLTIPDLKNVEFLDIELSADNREIDLEDIGSDVDTVMVDANDSYDFTVDNADAVDKITVKDAGNETATINDMADQSTVALNNSEDLVVTMNSSSDDELTVSVNAVTGAEISLDTNVKDLTISSWGSKSNVVKGITANKVTTLELKGAQDLEIEEVIGAGGLAKVTTVSGGAADGDLTLTLGGTTIESVVLGDGGDDLTIDGVLDSDAEVSTGDGNDDVTINFMVDSGTVDTGSGADDIVLNDALGTGEKIDGGSGSNDEISLTEDVTAGEITDVETINILSDVTVDFEFISDHANDVNILVSGLKVTVDKLPTFEIDTVDGAIIAIDDMESGVTASFDAAGDLDLEIDDTALTNIVADVASGSTLKIDSGLGTAVTDVTLTSAGSITLNGTQVAAVKELDASGVTSGLTIKSTDLVAITSYAGAGGVDDVEIDTTFAVTANFSLNGGNDVFVSAASGGTMYIDGGAGTDSFGLGSGGIAEVIVSSASDMKKTTLTSAATASALTTATSVTSLEASLAAKNYEQITGFDSGTDSIDLDLLELGTKELVTLAGAASAAGLTEDVQTIVQTLGNSKNAVIATEVNNDLDGDGDTDDTFVFVDVGSDNTNIGIFQIDDATLIVTDVDIT